MGVGNAVFFKKLFSERRDTTVRELQNIGLLWAKYGCYASKVRMFASKKSDVFVFRQGGKHGIRILLI